MARTHPTDKPIEDRDQTRHKLETMWRYWSAWLEILAKTRSPSFCTRRLWLIDLMSGGGHHESREHPDKVRAGTSVLAGWRAIQTQRAHHGVRVTLHSCDVDPSRVAALEAELAPIRGEPPDRIASVVHLGDYARFIPEIIDEIRLPCGSPFASDDHHHRSLWLLDPYGIKDIPRRTLDPIESLDGSELIVNLDTVDAGRHMAVVRSGNGPVAEDAANLDALFGDDSWRALDATRNDSAALAAISDLYASRFPGFDHRKPHRLRASMGQFRHLVHFSKHRKALTEFEQKFTTAMSAGTITGRALDQAQTAATAEYLAGLLDGVSISVDALEPLAGLANRGQVNTVVRAASERGLASVDEVGTITWHAEPTETRSIPMGL